MNVIYDGDFVVSDMDRLRADPAIAPYVDMIDEFLDELVGSHEAMRTLTEWPGENACPYFNVKGITTLQQAGYNLYRLRPLLKRLRDFRLIYAFDPMTDDYHLLAIVRKRPDVLPAGVLPTDFYDYEPYHPITKRVCDEYERLGLRKLC